MLTCVQLCNYGNVFQGIEQTVSIRGPKGIIYIKVSKYQRYHLYLYFLLKCLGNQRRRLGIHTGHLCGFYPQKVRFRGNEKCLWICGIFGEIGQASYFQQFWAKFSLCQKKFCKTHKVREKMFPFKDLLKFRIYVGQQKCSFKFLPLLQSI